MIDVGKYELESDIQLSVSLGPLVTVYNSISIIPSNCRNILNEYFFQDKPLPHPAQLETQM